MVLVTEMIGLDSNSPSKIFSFLKQVKPLMDGWTHECIVWNQVKHVLVD